MSETVAPCFEYCTTMAVFTVEDGRVIDQVDYPLRSRDPFDRVRLLRDRGVAVLICGGMQDIYETSLRGVGLEVISWVAGPVEELLDLYLRGRLVPGTEIPATPGTGTSWH
jgi:predicted Fe-Mo cluster-binding NifX family protein